MKNPIKRRVGESRVIQIYRRAAIRKSATAIIDATIASKNGEPSKTVIALLEGSRRTRYRTLSKIKGGEV